MIDNQEAKQIAAMLAALGEPTRLLILERLVHGPQNVGQLSQALGVPMVNMSHHLGVMRLAGLLENNKDGRRVVYEFRPEVFTPGDGKTTLGTLALGSVRMMIGGASEGEPDGAQSAAKKNPTRRK